MDATAVEDRPMIQNPEKMRESREKIKNIIYSEAVSQREGKRLPQTDEQLLKMWDDQIDKAEEERQKSKEEEDDGKVPDIVLKDLKEDDPKWAELGWIKDDREKVRNELKKVLGLKEPFVSHALECIIASGQKPDEVLAKITEDKHRETYAQVEQNYSQYHPSEEEKTLATKALFLEDILGPLENKIRYIKRFILYEEFDTNGVSFLGGHGGLSQYEGYNYSIQDEFRGKLPDNVFDLAWNIGVERKKRYGIDGKMPTLRMQVHKVKERDENGNVVKDENGKEKEKVEGRYVVDQANFMQWMREQIWVWYDEWDTDLLTDYFAQIKIDKGQFYTINLASMLFNKQLYFSDEKGHYWGDLWQQTLLEPWMMYFMRQYYLEYEKAMGSEEKLAETYNNTFFLSKFTRKLFGSSMVNIVSTLPIDFEGKTNSDTKLGEAVQTMQLIYYNMADYKRLQEILGDDSDFFSREFWENAINQIARKDTAATGVPQISQLLGDKLDDFIEAFSKGGKATDRVVNWEKFISFLNYFPIPVPTSSIVEIVDQGIKNIVKDKFESNSGNLDSKYVDTKSVEEGGEKTKDGKFVDKDNFSLNYAWLIAHSWKYITGAAAKNNFPQVSGHNAETKWFHTRKYREKYVGYGGGGNPYTIAMFKQLGIPLFEGILTENAIIDYDHVVKHDKDGNPVYATRNLTPMEIMLKMRKLSLDYEGDRKKLKDRIAEASGETRNKLEKELEELEDKEKNEYKMLASKLTFRGDAMRNYAQNIVGRAKVLYEQVMGAQEIDFEKFTKYDNIFRGVSFNRAEWQKALQGGLITPLRYLFDANGATNLNMKVRAPVFKGRKVGKDGKPKDIWEHEEINLGEAMLGHQVLDIPEFRRRAGTLTSEDRAKGFRTKGKYVVRPDGKFDIDYDRVQNNRTLVYKQWMLMKIAGDLWSHVNIHGTDPAYNMEHYMSILKAIEELPGDMLSDESDLKNTVITKKFFSHEQMAWLKRISGTTMTQMFTRQFFADLFMGDKKKQESAIGESATTILGGIFRGH